MSNEVFSAVKLLFLECIETNPDMSKIDEYIIRCCTNKEDINALFATKYKNYIQQLSPLHVACVKAHHEIVTKLINNSNHFKFPIDINVTSWPFRSTPLFYACRRSCSLLTVRALLQHPNIEVNGNINCLHEVCKYGQKTIVIELLKHPNIQVTAKHYSSRIPLHAACECLCDNATDIIQTLLDHQHQQHRIVQLNSVDESGQTPLHVACMGNVNKKVVLLLLEHSNDIDINATDTYLKTPLHYACHIDYSNEKNISNKKKVVMELLKYPNIQVIAKDCRSRMPLHIACGCRRGNTTDIIQMLLDHQHQQHRIVQLNAVDEKGQTPLHIACNVNKKVVPLLLEHSNVIDINAMDNDGNTPLHYACHLDSIKEKNVINVKHLLEQPSIMIDKENNKNRTPLDYCKRMLDHDYADLERKEELIYEEIVQLLEDYHTIMSDEVLSTIKLLIDECHEDNLDICKGDKYIIRCCNHLLKQPSIMIYKKSNSSGTSMIDLCMKMLDKSSLTNQIKSSYTEIFQLLKNNHLVLSYEVLSTVYLLINECNEDGPNISKIDDYIHRCCINKEDINTFFLMNCAQPYKRRCNSYELTALHVACRMDHHAIVTKLLNNSNDYKFPIDINASGPDDETPLFYACRHDGSPLTVRALLQHPNIEVNNGNSNIFTPLHEACHHGNKEVVIELLKHPKIQIMVKSRYCQIPLHTACRCRFDNTDIIQMLLDHQQQQHRTVQLNAVDDTGLTPLHNACMIDVNKKIVPQLLEHATIMNINAIDNDGNTPLHYTCSERYLSEKNVSDIKHLLEQPSIMIYKKNNNGETPFDIIRKRMLLDDSEIKQCLKKIIQLFDDYRIERRQKIYCFLINYYENMNWSHNKGEDGNNINNNNNFNKKQKIV